MDTTAGNAIASVQATVSDVWMPNKVAVCPTVPFVRTDITPRHPCTNASQLAPVTVRRVNQALLAVHLVIRVSI